MLLTRVKSGKPARKSRSAELCAHNGPANKHANRTAAATLAYLRVLDRLPKPGGANQAPDLRFVHGPSSSFMPGSPLLRGPEAGGPGAVGIIFEAEGTVIQWAMST